MWINTPNTSPEKQQTKAQELGMLNKQEISDAIQKMRNNSEFKKDLDSLAFLNDFKNWTTTLSPQDKALRKDNLWQIVESENLDLKQEREELVQKLKESGLKLSPNADKILPWRQTIFHMRQAL